ncbi:hypothetical protein Tco_0403874 [Tanacetum coccineum]
MACDVSWKAKLSTLHDENVLLKHQVESTVNERENIKLKFQRLFNSIKATWAQHQNEINEMIENVNQKTYAYTDVRAQNQDLLMTISELKSKLRMIEKRKNVNTKFDTSETLGKLLCVCSFMLCDLDFEPLSLSLSSMPSCDLVSLANIFILCLILKAPNQSLRKSLSLKLELS